MIQDALMKYDPATGEEKPYSSHAAQWRTYHGKAAWLYNPWTGIARNPLDIGSDPFGHGIDNTTVVASSAEAPTQSPGPIATDWVAAALRGQAKFLTWWYAALENPPTLPGVYEVSYGKFPFRVVATEDEAPRNYAYYNGAGLWGRPWCRVGLAHRDKNLVSARAPRWWRGLAFDPNRLEELKK